jgi:hypothetical protein
MAGVARSEEHISLNFNTGAAASGRKQPVAVLLVALRQLSDQGRGGSQLFRYSYGSVAAIHRKIVVAISKTWWAQPGAAVAFVASISESHSWLYNCPIFTNSFLSHRKNLFWHLIKNKY